MEEKGISGKIAGAFLTSKLSILFMISFLLLGIFSIYMIPREEEPQIDVPMADIMIAYPGASPKEIEHTISEPIEKIVSNIKGVEDVYSTSMDGMAMLTVQFYVGENVERSLVNLYNELIKHMDHMPQGVTMPMIKTRAIDDVPVLGLTLWSDKTGNYSIRQMAEVVAGELKKIPDVAQINIIGGQSRQVKVVLDKERMNESNVDFNSIAQALQGNNAQTQSGFLMQNDKVYTVTTGKFFADADEIKQTIIGVDNGQPVYLYQVAKIEDGAEEPSSYVSFGFGAASADQQSKHPGTYEAVTIAIAKKKGADAMKLADSILKNVEKMKKDLITSDVQIDITRNYGQTASHKVSELLLHLIIGIIIVTVFVMLAMGWRGGLVVFLSVPITFALTLFAYFFLGYTLNRITLFALVFVTGIVTDDSIVIAENMYRHFQTKKLPPYQLAIRAINEVGNPTILATLTVIAAVLPMAFVSGMMGPYMSPMPIGASIAMIFSLLIALTLTPYFGFLFLRYKGKKNNNNKETTEVSTKDKEEDIKKNWIYRYYYVITTPLLESRWKRWSFMLALSLILFVSLSMFYTKQVSVKMLPFDNKNEFQVVVDMPEGTTLERTTAVTQALSSYLSRQKEVTNFQAYAGIASPISFNGLVRHYDLRRNTNTADIQVNLTDKDERSKQSHDIAKSMREPLQSIAQQYGANVKIVEMPPGPPVMSTVLAEIYGPNYEEQIRIAEQVKNILQKTNNVVDVDWMVEDPQTEVKFDVDKDHAMKRGIASGQIVQAMRGALSGQPVGILHQPASLNQTPIILQLPQQDRSDLQSILGIKVLNMQGKAQPVSDLVKVRKQEKEKSIYRKNQKRVVYVTAEVAGNLESPIYAMNDVSEKLSTLKLPKGYSLEEAYSAQPDSESNFTLKWDGEWKITYEVFRDLGLAFLFVLIIIYMLIVGWFQNFTTPLVQLAAIPLSLIGIVVGHWMAGAYFTATSMIGFIALAGIMVRNSILLIDFIDMRIQQGIPLKQAVIEAGAVRTTPIVLTAGSVVLSGIVMIFDPIFQGLAISLMGGTITSTILTLVVVPLLYFKQLKGKHTKKV